jgi:hypothetical protein
MTKGRERESKPDEQTGQRQRDCRRA